MKILLVNPKPLLRQGLHILYPPKVTCQPQWLLLFNAYLASAVISLGGILFFIVKLLYKFDNPINLFIIQLLQ